MDPRTYKICDAKAAIGYLRTHADRYLIDKDKVFVTGESAGARVSEGEDKAALIVHSENFPDAAFRWISTELPDVTTVWTISFSRKQRIQGLFNKKIGGGSEDVVR